MEKEMKIIGLDGADEIIYSGVFNVYENELTIPELLGFKVKFIFETTEPAVDQKDVVTKSGTDNEIIVTLSKKFRNSLGSITQNKLGILTSNGRQISFSVFGQQVGSDILNITVNFYRK